MKNEMLGMTYIVSSDYELEDVWMGHCLQLDVVSQGNSPEHALAMVMEASAILYEDDCRARLDPWARCAPPEFWPPKELASWEKLRKKLRGLQESLQEDPVITVKQSPAEIAKSLTPAQCRFDIGKKRRFNDCTTNTVATMRALEGRGLGARQRMGYGSGRPDYTWHPSDLGRAVAAEFEKN